MLVAASALGVIQNNAFGIESSYDDVHTVGYWVGQIPITLVVTIWIAVLVYPLSLIFYGNPERSQKLLSIRTYTTMGVIFGLFWIAAFQGYYWLSSSCCDVWDFFNAAVWPVAGFFAGVTFGIMRTKILRPRWATNP